MGLAASQARFLGITARKSNIEYEGQQVNQQRTVLSQEVSDLYNKLMQLDKPIQPVQSDFYETNYNFEIPDEPGIKEKYSGSYQINNYKKRSDGSYMLSVTRTYEEDKIEAKLKNNTLNVISHEEDKYYYIDQSGNKIELTKVDENQTKTIQDMIKRDCTTAQQPTGSGLYTYTSTSDGSIHYFDSNAVENFVQGSTNLYSYDFLENQQAEEDILLYAASAELDTYGNIKDFKDVYAIDSEGKNIALSTQTNVEVSKKLNEEKMEEAMRNYTLQVDEYNRDYAKLNAETEDLQQQDKVLELRLDQIDTEEQELSTELEAVKKVIENNIENTFKTFA